VTVASYLEPHADGVLLTVWVVPGAKQTQIVGPHGDALKIRVAAPPEAGKANRELLILLEQLIEAEVTLIRGASSRRKTFLVEGVALADVRVRLNAARD
jgi:uncharacterized protein (TIGR00251 family)